MTEQHPWPLAHMQEGDLLAEALEVARSRHRGEVSAADARLSREEARLGAMIHKLAGRAFPGLEVTGLVGVKHSRGLLEGALLIERDTPPPTHEEDLGPEEESACPPGNEAGTPPG